MQIVKSVVGRPDHCEMRLGDNTLNPVIQTKQGTPCDHWRILCTVKCMKCIKQPLHTQEENY